MDERVATRSRTRAGLWQLAGPWWMFLLTGIRVAHPVVGCTGGSPPRLGSRRWAPLLGVLFLVAMVNEFFIASVRSSWRLAARGDGRHLCLRAPAGSFAPALTNAFWTLASILGLLLIFRGHGSTFITSASTREVNSAWWLGMVAGILEVLLGFWASPAVPPGTRSAAADLGRLLSALFRRHLGDRDRLRASAAAQHP